MIKRKIAKEINFHLEKLDKISVAKPDLKPGESRDDWMARCIPFLIREGKEQDEAAGQCGGMFEQGKKTEKYEIDNSKYEALTYNSPEDFEIDGITIKKGEELRYILGVVLEPETVDATRTDKTIGDIYSEEEVRKAAHNFMMTYSGSGNDLMHSGRDNSKLKIVESYIAPGDMAVGEAVVKRGTWMMATLVLDNKIWESVKKGEITGYSIGGYSSARIEAPSIV